MSIGEKTAVKNVAVKNTAARTIAVRTAAIKHAAEKNTDNESDAMKLYKATMRILDQGYDVEIRKGRDYIKVNKVARKTETEMVF